MSNPAKYPEYILIDDDFNLTKIWQMLAELEKVRLITFPNITKFEKVKNRFNKNMPIYIDYQLSSANGLEYSKQLAAEGFNNLYLATGHDKSHFQEATPWLKAIVGKEPPFVSDVENKRSAALPENTATHCVNTTDKTGKSGLPLNSISDDPKIEAELWKVWFPFHHDLISGPVTLRSRIGMLVKYLPKLVDYYREQHPNLDSFSDDEINSNVLNFLQDSGCDLESILSAHILKIQMKTDATSTP